MKGATDQPQKQFDVFKSVSHITTVLQKVMPFRLVPLQADQLILSLW
jgi:hypothetical protein